MTPKILSVDDSRAIRMVLKRLFRPFACELFEAGDGEEGLAVATREKPDLIILDYNMPVMDGLTMLRKMRENPELKRTPVIMLTADASSEIIHTVARLGVRDYVTKPFSMDELLARVEVLGRRGGASIPEDMVHIGGIVMEVGKRRVTLQGEVVALSPREFDVLRIFMQEPGRVFSRDEICERIWNREHEYDTRTVEIFIMRLRKKLCAGGEEPLIETVRGVGYKMRRP